MTSFNVEYTPTEVGRHRIDVKYADANIMGSPFYPEVFDASLVRVGNIPIGIIDQWVYFDGELSMRFLKNGLHHLIAGIHVGM